MQIDQNLFLSVVTEKFGPRASVRRHIHYSRSKKGFHRQVMSRGTLGLWWSFLGINGGNHQGIWWKFSD